MIIGHYHPVIWAKGGIATYIRRIGAAQRLLGHKVYYFTRSFSSEDNEQEHPIVVNSDEALFSQAEKLGLDILHLHQTVAIPQSPSLAVIRTLHGHEPYCPSGSRYLKRSSQPCDRAYSPMGCLWGHFFDHCGSVRLHNLFLNFQQTQREQANLAKIPVITVSKFLKEQMLRAGYSADSIHVLHLFAPEIVSHLPPPTEGIPHFVFLGRISPEKGLEWLIRSLRQISVPVHLDIAGEGYQEPELKQLVEQLDLGDRVTFHGWISLTQVNQLIQNARALVFPSLWHEPGGTVAFEAMANSRAVIMSRVGGMPEVVLQDVNGCLVEPNHVGDLADSIERLATDWSLAQRLGEMGRRMAVEQFALKNHLEQLFQLYQQVIHQHGIQPSQACIEM